MTKQIKITCKAGALLPIDKIENFQGKLKEIDEASFEKLKTSILKYGFSFPIFVWDSKILDGHQRLAAIKRLIDEGYTLQGGKLPVAEIQAQSETEAAEKLLLINSRYAKIVQEGFDQFITDFNIDLEEMFGLLEIPEIDFDFSNEDRENDNDTITKDGLEYKVLIECEDENHQVAIIKKIEDLGIECKPLIF